MTFKASLKKINKFICHLYKNKLSLQMHLSEIRLKNCRINNKSKRINRIILYECMLF